jgi:hypothetical protein
LRGEWKGYNGLEAIEYPHTSVCHTRHFVDPVSGVHTQKIESSWHYQKRCLTNQSYTAVRPIPAYATEFCARRGLGFDANRIWQALYA